MSALIVSILIIIEACIPTNQDMYIMLGGYYVTNNAELKKMPDAVFKATNDFLASIKPKEVVNNVKEAVKEATK